MVRSSRYRVKLRSWFGSIVLGWAAVCAGAASDPADWDRIERRDGSTVEGRLLRVDDETVVLRGLTGKTIRLERAQVATIRLAATPAAAPPWRVELRAVGANDSADVFLNGETLLREVRTQGEWLDITDRIKTGNNELRLRIRNERASWAYDLTLRVNGVATPIRCGSPTRAKPCTCCGLTGEEVGVLDLPPIWIWADRAAGVVELVP